jgi:hypothetical protein
MTRPHLVAMATLLVLGLACSRGSDEPKLSPKESARLDSALASLDTTSERVRKEVLRTCDKWKRHDRPCTETAIRIDQLDCWLEAGILGWRSGQEKGLGPYSGDRRAMVAQNVCLQKRAWNKVERGVF